MRSMLVTRTGLRMPVSRSVAVDCGLWTVDGCGGAAWLDGIGRACDTGNVDADVFWTQKRLEALSRTSLTLFQAFLIALVLGGVWGKIGSIWLKVLFTAATVVFFLLGVACADWPIRKER